MSKALTYRADIDTLRAVAVLSVVCFHFSKTWLPGGFLGVDVFFVISGFLITLILHREMNAGVFCGGAHRAGVGRDAVYAGRFCNVEPLGLGICAFCRQLLFCLRAGLFRPGAGRKTAFAYLVAFGRRAILFCVSDIAVVGGPPQLP